MKNLKSLALIGFALMAVTVARGTVLYDDTTTPVAGGAVLTLTNNELVGDQFTLGNVGAPYLTNFSIEYYSPDSTFSGSVQMDVRFYLNDGTPFNGYPTPGTKFYDSGLFSVSTPQSIYPGTNSAVLDFDLSDLLAGDGPGALGLGLTYQLPTNFTVAVFFQGLSGSDQVGLDMFDPATLGSNFGDYWLDNVGSWQLLTNSTAVAFGMQLNGQAVPTPEPAAWGLTAVGTVLLTVFARRRKK